MRTIWRLPRFGRARSPFDAPLRGIVATHRKRWVSVDGRVLRWRARRRLDALEADALELQLAALAYDVHASVGEIVERWRAGEPAHYESQLIRTVTALQMRIGGGWAFEPPPAYHLRFDPWQVAAPLDIGLDPGLRPLLLWPVDFEALAAWLAQHDGKLQAFVAYVLQRPREADRMGVTAPSPKK
jgi:hypothetical protein